MNLNKFRIRTFLALSILAATACAKKPDVVPSQYQGTFAESSSKTQLVINADSATYLGDGSNLSAHISQIGYDQLLAGTGGMYVEQDNANLGILHVYWITPDLTSKQEAGGLLYYKSELVYVEMDANQKDAAQALEVIHSKDGMVMLDEQAKSFQIGWGAKPIIHTLIRAQAAPQPTATPTDSAILGVERLL